MLIGTFSLGDLVTTLTARMPLTADDSVSYILTSTDLVTDKTYSKVYMGENDAARAFCAAISADEPDLTKDCEVLRADPAMKPFLP